MNVLVALQQLLQPFFEGFQKQLYPFEGGNDRGFVLNIRLLFDISGSPLQGISFFFHKVVNELQQTNIFIGVFTGSLICFLRLEHRKFLLPKTNQRRRLSE